MPDPALLNDTIYHMKRSVQQQQIIVAICMYFHQVIIANIAILYGSMLCFAWEDQSEKMC